MNQIFAIKTINKDKVNSTILYKLEPPTQGKTEYLLVKQEKTENPRFPELDFINFLYAKSNSDGTPQSEWKRYATIESNNEKASNQEIRKQYGGLGKANVEEYRNEYKDKFKTNHKEFMRDKSYYFHKLQDPSLDPMEKSIYGGIIKVMDEVAGGIYDTPISENPEIKKTLEKLFSNIDTGYKLVDKPKTIRKLELENKIRKIKLKNLSVLNEAPKIDIDDVTLQPKTPLERSKRFQNLFSNDSGNKSSQTDLDRLNNFEQSQEDSATNVVNAADAKMQKVNLTETVDNYNAKIIFACDQNGNLTNYQNAYLIVWWFQEGIPMSHLGQQYKYNYLAIRENTVHEISFEGNPKNVLNENIQKSLKNYLSTSKYEPEQTLLKNMETYTKGNLMFNGNLMQGVQFFKKIPVDKNNSTQFKYIQTSVPVSEITNFIENSTKDKGGGLGSILTKTTNARPSDRLEDKSWEKDPLYQQANQRVNQLRQEFLDFDKLNRELSDDEKDAKFDIGIAITKAEKERDRIATQAKQKNQSTKDYQITYVDKGYRILPSKFNASPDKKIANLDLRDPNEIKSAPVKQKRKITINPNTGAVETIEENLNIILSNDKMNKFLQKKQ